MARTSKKQNEELLQQAYFAVVKEYSLDESMSLTDKVHFLILKADDIQTEICEKADFIKIDAYDSVVKTWEELGMPKNVWLELVHLRRLQRHTTLSDDCIAKIALSFEGAKNVTALRSTLLDAFKNNNLSDIQVPTCDTVKTLEFEKSEDLSEDFIELLNECSDVRHEIDSQLYPRLRLLGDAFCYITKEPYARFKQLLDLWHYRNGGWPKETTPPRIWSVIARFISNYDALQQYGFNMGESWCKRLGLSVKRFQKSPTSHMFTEKGERFGQYFMAKLKTDTEAKYPQYQFKPYHHIIANNGIFFAYVWDTRMVEFYGNSNDLCIDDLDFDYIDNCDALVTDSADIQNLLEQHVPSAIIS